MASDGDFEIVDGLAEPRERYGVGFGDIVRIQSSPETERLGYAGLVGQVFGETAPSMGAIREQPLVGEPEEDFALYVDFDDREGAWFAPELVEFVDHGTVEPTFIRRLLRRLRGRA
jgi:hypothetical protein